MERCKKCGGPVVYVQMDSGHRVPIDKYTIEERVVVREDGTAFRNKCGTSHYKTCQGKRRWRMSK